MKAFAVLLLAGAVAASAIPEQQGIEQGMQQGLNPLISDSTRSIINAKLFTVYGAPLISREHLLPEERMGLKGLVEKSFIVAYKPQGSNEMKAFLLKGGLSSLPNNPDAAFLKEMLLNSPEKVGITLSGAHYLDLPELSLPIRSLHMPHDFNLHTAFRSAQDGYNFPWVYMVSKDELRAGSLERLSELGQMELRPEGLRILRELPAAVKSLYAEEPVFEVIPNSGFIAPETGLRKVHFAPSELSGFRKQAFFAPSETTSSFKNVHYLTPAEAAAYGKVHLVPSVSEAGIRKLQLHSANPFTSEVSGDVYVPASQIPASRFNPETVGVSRIGGFIG